MDARQAVHDRVLALAAPELELLGFDLVEFETLAGGNRLTLRFAVDRMPAEGEVTPTGGITVDEISRASRAIAKVIEAEEAEAGEFIGRYTIEVSSPGIFRKLTRPDHYRRYAGEIVKVVADAPDDGTEQVRGRLLAYEDGRIRVDDAERGEVEIELDRVRRAKLDPDLDFGGRSERR